MRTVLALALLLAGCATQPQYAPHHWSDFRTARIEIMTNQVMSGPNKDVPAEVIDAYAVCAADYLLSYTTAADKAALDAWARQERPFSTAENDAYEARVREAGAVTIAYNFDDLARTCPDKVPLFKQYFH